MGTLTRDTLPSSTHETAILAAQNYADQTAAASATWEKTTDRSREDIDNALPKAASTGGFTRRRTLRLQGGNMTHTAVERLLRLAAMALLALAVACAGPGIAPQATANAEAVVRDFTAAINAGNKARVTELLAVGGQVFHEPVTEETRDEIIASLNCAAEIVSLEASGERVTARVRFTGTSSFAATECGAVGVEETVVYLVRGGKIMAVDEP
jgi:hypothetical protein